MSDMTYDCKCVCQICTCGKHKCPSNIHQYSPELLKSVFKKDYVPWDIDRVKSFKEPGHYFPSSYDPEDLKSMFTKDYDPKKQLPAESMKRASQFIPSNLPFPKESEYAYNYKKFDVSRTCPLDRKPYRFPDIPFDHNSTYKVDYNKKQADRDRYLITILLIY